MAKVTQTCLVWLLSLQRTREVLAVDATSNARVQSLSRGLRKKTKLGKIFFSNLFYKIWVIYLFHQVYQERYSLTRSELTHTIWWHGSDVGTMVLYRENEPQIFPGLCTRLYAVITLLKQ